MPVNVLNDPPPYARERIHARLAQKVKERGRAVTCGSCGDTATFWEPMDEDDRLPQGYVYAMKCGECGAIVESWRREPAAEQKGPNLNPDWEDFIHPNLGHEPVLVRGRQHFERLCEERGLYVKSPKR